MRPRVKLTSFHSLLDEGNLQLLDTTEPWESICQNLSYRIALEIPRIENMLNNQKVIINFSNKNNHFFTFKCFS